MSKRLLTHEQSVEVSLGALRAAAWGIGGLLVGILVMGLGWFIPPAYALELTCTAIGSSYQCNGLASTAASYTSAYLLIPFLTLLYAWYRSNEVSKAEKAYEVENLRRQAVHASSAMPPPPSSPLAAQGPPAPPPPMFCAGCGTALAPGTSVCARCGRPVARL